VGPDALASGPMSKISVIAKLTVAEGKADELEQRLAELISAADDEPGLEVYSAHRDTQDEGVYWFFEVYRDGDAFAEHGKGDRMRGAMKALGGLLGGRPEVIMMEPVVAKGLAI
jgi:quinol monooxygenase YgiN